MAEATAANTSQSISYTISKNVSLFIIKNYAAKIQNKIWLLLLVKCYLSNFSFLRE
jgi:hypothetical protein